MRASVESTKKRPIDRLKTFGRALAAYLSTLDLAADGFYASVSKQRLPLDVFEGVLLTASSLSGAGTEGGGSLRKLIRKLKDLTSDGIAVMLINDHPVTATVANRLGVINVFEITTSEQLVKDICAHISNHGHHFERIAVIVSLQQKVAIDALKQVDDSQPGGLCVFVTDSASVKDLPVDWLPIS